MSKTKISAIILAAMLFVSVFAASVAAVPLCAYAQDAQTVDFYAINDFHGEVDRMPVIAGYLAARQAEGNAVVLNSGDMFQGSMESNSNYGKLLTDCMDLAGFDEFTFGNHEFDWGLDNLRKLASESEVPFLGANIYNWDAETRTWGDFADDLADKYIVKKLDNGLTVGVIGVIGADQITSISSQLVQTIGFKDPLPIIQELATELRNEQDCDIVVASVHAGPQDIVGEEEDFKQPSSAAGLEEYVDAVFCAHTHSAQDYIVDGIPFIQGRRYGEYVSHVQLSVSDDGEVSVTAHGNIPKEQLKDIDQNVRNQVSALIEQSNQSIAAQANEVLAATDATLNSGTAIPRLVCHAIADYAVSQGYDINLAMVNVARNAINKGDITYTKLYNAIPFDNVVYIATVSGADILKEASYSGNCIWRVKGESIKNNGTYTIAVIDYLLYHQNSRRNYNYFPSAFTSGAPAPIALTKQGEEVYNYRLITRDFLRKSQSITASTYTKDSDNTNAELLGSALSGFVSHVGPVVKPTPPVPTTLPTWAIVLIVVGAVAVIAAIVVVVVVVLIKRNRAKNR